MLRLPDASTRTHGPLFLSEQRPVLARRPAVGDVCPHTDRTLDGLEQLISTRTPEG
ncbi:hypothetical protein AB0J63_21095 [Streptosporangium canum]|uniref:hypothetical protein n=1 Tax=Streptosporangium canum TaxID=324952 RepID=UPI00341D2930